MIWIQIVIHKFDKQFSQIQLTLILNLFLTFFDLNKNSTSLDIVESENQIGASF